MSFISSFIFHLSSLQFKQRFVLIGLLSSVLLPLQAQKVLADNDFSKPDLEKWQKPITFERFSAIEYTQEKGAILKRNPNQKPIKGRLYDTAFDFRSKAQSLPANAEEWCVVVTAFSSHRNAALKGYGRSYHCRVVWYDKAGKKMDKKDSNYIPVLKAGQLITTEARGKVPAGAAKAEVHFGFDSPDLNPGEYIALRRVTLTVGSKKEMDALPAKGDIDHFITLKSVSPAENAKVPVVFHIRNGRLIDWKKSSFLLNGKDVTKNVTRKHETFTLKPAPAFDKGLNLLVLKYPSKSGATLELEMVFYVGKVMPCHKMTLRDDGMAMMDGKPFFPLGIACLVKQGRNGNSYDRAFKEISEAGMDFCRHWSSFNAEWKDAPEYLACAKKYGVFVSFAPTRVKNDVKVSRVAKGVAAQLNLERVILWDTGDDTSGWIRPDELAAKYQAVKAVDPWRLTTQADPVGGGAAAGPIGKSNYTDYVKSSDNFQPEVYPIGNYRQQKETPELIAKGIPVVIRNMQVIAADVKKNGGVKKNIWPLIQYFYYKPTSNYWVRMPTEAELRCMSFLAIIHGCHGIVWYRYAGYPGTPNGTRGYSEQEWKTISTLSKQLRSIIGVLEARTGKQTQSVSVLAGPKKDAGNFDSVNTLLKEYNGKKYLFVANSAYAKVTASFTVPGMKKARDLFGKKEMAVKNGKFTKELTPFDALVFEIQ